jgi:hypothetical protein
MHGWNLPFHEPHKFYYDRFTTNQIFKIAPAALRAVVLTNTVLVVATLTLPSSNAIYC